jgi:hypothetical protein
MQWSQITKELNQNPSKKKFIEQERFKQVDELLTRLSKVKIIDAPVLLKLYELYRYRPEN